MLSQDDAEAGNTGFEGYLIHCAYEYRGRERNSMEPAIVMRKALHISLTVML